jgi:hypothetical protein
MVPLPGTIWAEMDTTSVSQQFYTITKATNRTTIRRNTDSEHLFLRWPIYPSAKELASPRQHASTGWSQRVWKLAYV